MPVVTASMKKQPCGGAVFLLTVNCGFFVLHCRAGAGTHAARTPVREESRFQSARDRFEESAAGKGPYGHAVEAEHSRKVLGHFAALYGVYRRFLESVCEVDEFGVAVEFAAFSESARPRKESRNGIGGSLFTVEIFIVVPCHRVVFADGSLTSAFAFGDGVQREWLESEGVTFIGDKVDMEKHFMSFGTGHDEAE